MTERADETARFVPVAPGFAPWCAGGPDATHRRTCSNIATRRWVDRALEIACCDSDVCAAIVKEEAKRLNDCCKRR